MRFQTHETNVLRNKGPRITVRGEFPLGVRRGVFVDNLLDSDTRYARRVDGNRYASMVAGESKEIKDLRKFVFGVNRDDGFSNFR